MRSARVRETRASQGDDAAERAAETSEEREGENALGRGVSPTDVSCGMV